MREVSYGDKACREGEAWGRERRGGETRSEFMKSSRKGRSWILIRISGERVKNGDTLKRREEEDEEVLEGRKRGKTNEREEK